MIILEELNLHLRLVFDTFTSKLVLAYTYFLILNFLSKLRLKSSQKKVPGFVRSRVLTVAGVFYNSPDIITMVSIGREGDLKYYRIKN